MKKLLVVFLIICSSLCFGSNGPIQPGAQQTKIYLPMLKGKRVGVFVNQSSLIGNLHLIDELLKHHINIVKIFAPEHGFRGNKDERVNDEIDPKTGIPIISLYGKKLKPTASNFS